MLYFTTGKEKCAGCTACKTICPTQCISMKRDEEGFLYPCADTSKCIHCGACESVCPILKKASDTAEGRINQFAAAAICRNQNDWEQSASGGAFKSICDGFAEMNSGKPVRVYGAAFNQLYVEHKGKEYPEIREFHKSKYVQSDLKNCFSEIKQDLIEGKAVVFSGTPCQVAGLKCLLKKDYENLLCIDLICHGVGSPTVFSDYLSEKEKQTGKKIISYTFRTKKKKWGNYERHRSIVEYSDGSVEAEVEDPYNRLFLNQLCLRDCCGENCHFRNLERWGDLTIADFNNFIRSFPDQKDNRGHSTIVVNTEKGRSVYERLPEFMTLLPCSLDNIAKYNPLLVRSTSGNPDRERFFKDYEKGESVIELSDKYAPKRKEPISIWIKKHIPFEVKYTAYKIVRKLNGVGGKK